ncbi:MAG: hypothetical protein ACLFU8_09775, partial [Anaerolineales bacterium]
AIAPKITLSQTTELEFLPGDMSKAEDSEAVKERAGEIVEAKQPFKTKEDLQNTVAQVESQLKSEGLKSLKAQPGSDPSTHDIIATASPEEKVAAVKIDYPGPQVKAAIERLKALANNNKIWYQYRYGLQKQVERAEYWLSQGRLVGVEVWQPEGGGRIDIELTDPEQVVECKYWTQEHTDRNLSKLGAQLKKYQKTSKPVILELAKTKTKPISLEYVQGELKDALALQGLTFDDTTINEEDDVISVVVKLVQPQGDK